MVAGMVAARLYLDDVHQLWIALGCLAAGVGVFFVLMLVWQPFRHDLSDIVKTINTSLLRRRAIISEPEQERLCPADVEP